MGKEGQFLVDVMRGRNERMITSGPVRFVSSHRKKKSAVLFATESSITIWRSKGLPKSPKRLFFQTWFRLKHFLAVSRCTRGVETEESWRCSSIPVLRID
jgi:hypothetical protein